MNLIWEDQNADGARIYTVYNNKTIILYNFKGVMHVPDILD